MGILLNTYARTYQGILWLVTHFLNFHEPKLLMGANEIENIPYLLRSKGKKCVLVVTDEQIYKLGLTNALTKEFEKACMPYALFHGVTANPSVTNVEDGLELFKQNGCDCLVAVGGGSSMDACKAIGARVVNPRKSVNQMKGLLKVRHNIPMMIAVPTTAGTGSETTLAAVIVDRKTGDKYAINDLHLIPDYAILDPTLLLNLPKHITSTTGMDALTHAVEAFIGHSNTKKTKKYSLSAVKLIFEYLEKSVNEPNNMTLHGKVGD